MIDLSVMKFLGLTIQTWITVGISGLSLVLSLMTFSRYWRHHVEASWTPVFFVDVPRAEVPPLDWLGYGEPIEIARLINDGDGDAFDVRTFGHECIVRSFQWEKKGSDSWSTTEQELLYRVPSGQMAAWLVVWPPKGHERLPNDAKICIHWIKSPTRLRRCGYVELKVSEKTERWWEDRNWKAWFRPLARFSLWLTHRRFHRNPIDAVKAPKPSN